MDALQDFFFWTWKIGNSTQLNTSSSPMWHYQLGLQQGWIPKGEILLLCVKSEKSLPQKYPNNPNPPLSLKQIQEKPSDTAPKFCPRHNYLMEIFLLQRPEVWVSFFQLVLSPLSANLFLFPTNLYWWSFFYLFFSQAGAGTLDPVQSASHTFPPPTISPSFSGTQISLLPTYTPTGSLKTLFAPTFTAAPTAAVGTGWNNANDNDPAYVYVSPIICSVLSTLTYGIFQKMFFSPVSGCSYPE